MLGEGKSSSCANRGGARPTGRGEINKHHPQPSRTWEEIVASTASGRRIAKYRPGVQIEELEMSYHRDGHLLFRKQTESCYYVIRGDVIGASQGEETGITLIKRRQSGAVHGYPITQRELDDYLRKSR